MPTFAYLSPHSLGRSSAANAKLLKYLERLLLALLQSSGLGLVVGIVWGESPYEPANLDQEDLQRRCNELVLASSHTIVAHLALMLEPETTALGKLGYYCPTAALPALLVHHGRRQVATARQQRHPQQNGFR